jgi:hypothetical protein
VLFTPRPKGLGSENFLKLNDQEEVTGLFRGELYTFKRHWVRGNGKERGEECTGPNCPFCLADSENYPSFRFRVNFVTTKDGQWVAKIFEGGGELYDLLSSLDKKFDLSKTVVDITRRGLKQSTKYDITPRLDQPVTKEFEARIKSVVLVPLKSDETDGA